MERLLINYPYVVSLILFAIGIMIVLMANNLMKKLLGFNISEASVFLFFIAMGNLRDGRAPVIDLSADVTGRYVNPLPSVLILTGIVVSVSVTAFALSLIVKLYRFYGTLNMDEIMAFEDRRRRGLANE